MFVKNSYTKMFLFICILIVSIYSFSASQTNKTNKTEWYEYYEDALNYAEREDWNTTIDLLQKAIEKDPEPKEQKRTYGIYSIDYYPYLELAKAYHEIGDKEAEFCACKKAQEWNLDSVKEAVKNCLDDLKNLDDAFEVKNCSGVLKPGK